MSVYPRRNGKGRPLDLTGFKFGKLKVIEESYIKNYKHYWLCKCECGNECIVYSSNLTIGKTKSCGCLKHKSYHITHGLGKPKETYSHWYNIKTKKHVTDNLLRQRGFDQLFNTNYGKGTSNEDLMRDSGFVEIYDCGQNVWEWRLESLG